MPRAEGAVAIVQENRDAAARRNRQVGIVVAIEEAIGDGGRVVDCRCQDPRAEIAIAEARKNRHAVVWDARSHDGEVGNAVARQIGGDQRSRLTDGQVGRGDERAVAIANQHGHRSSHPQGKPSGEPMSAVTASSRPSRLKSPTAMSIGC